MSQRKWPLPTSSLRQSQSNLKNDQSSPAGTSQAKNMSEGEAKNVVVAPDGSIFVRTLVQVDPDSDLFMKVAQSAYADHERSLVQCTKCLRRFFPDRIEKHERNCAAEKMQCFSSKPRPKK